MIVVLSALAGCRGGRRVAHVERDELGRDVALSTWPARRVVSLATSNTEILFAIGAGATVVGVDVYANWPAAVTAVPRVGTQQEPSVEAVLGLRPDVVVSAMSANRQSTVEALERLGLPVFVTRTDDLAGLGRTIVDLGTLVGQRTAADALVHTIQAGLAQVQEQVREQAQQHPRVRALVLVWSDPLYVVGRQTYTADLLALAGGDNVAADAEPGYPRYSIERVLRQAPEVMVMGTHTDERTGDPWHEWRRFPTLPAVRDGRLITVDGDLIFRPGPRAVEAAQTLARALHPRARILP
jgi:ABC-type Fe3+-hydroxamate transport system substrate-binding protein